MNYKIQVTIIFIAIMFDKLTDYEIIDIFLQFDSIWDIAYATTICKKFQTLIHQNAYMFFKQICGVDIMGHMGCEEKDIICAAAPVALEYTDFYDYVAIYKLFSMMNIKIDDLKDYEYHELLYSDDFRPDVLILDPRYLDRIESEYYDTIIEICRKYMNGYVSCFDKRKNMKIPTNENIMKYVSGNIYNTEKYKYLLSDPYEEIEKSGKSLSHESPYAFYKSKILNTEMHRTNARDIIKIIVCECEHHCACWSETGTYDVKIAYENGIITAHVYFNTES